MKAKPIKALTPSQEQVLSFIRDRCSQGLSPSYREIQSHFGYKAVGTVQDHVKALRKKGFLETVKLGRRGALLPTGRAIGGTKVLPIYGEIAAGSTRESLQIEIGTLVVPTDLAKDPCFALRVVGDSMIGAGILEGDYLIVERTSDARSGDIVVAMLRGETTVKRYIHKRNAIFLFPENPRMKPIAVDHEDFSIQGKVVGLQRRF